MPDAATTAAQIAEEMQLSEREVAERLELLQLSAGDRARLRALAPRILASADAIVRSFHGRLASDPQARLLIPPEVDHEDLRDRLRQYLTGLFSGSYGLDYARHRLRVGVTHQRHRITPKWYISASSWWLSAVLDALLDTDPDVDREELTADLAALLKLLLYDLSLVLETYFHADHQAMERLATHDQLTGLPNINRLREQLELRMGRPAPAPLPCLLLVGLDQFKAINGTLGHDVGDELLQTVARRLQGVVDEQEMVVRLGGDLFVVLCERCQTEGQAAALARILEVFRQPFELGDVAVNVHATVGAVCAQEPGTDASTLLRQAETALLHAKSRRATHATYEPAMDRFNLEQVRLVGELRRALERGELVLHYQPKIDLKTGRPRGVEALIRWNRPEGAQWLPHRFVPLAEQTVLIHPVTDWVLETAAAQAAEWQRAGLAIDVSVNIAAPNLHNAKLSAQVRDIIERQGLDPSRLVLELTESTLLADPRRAHETVAELRELGVRLAIDDFGTGYSSLAYLRELPIHEVKLDCSFVTDMVSDERNARIVQATIALAHSLGLSVTAEGVEDQATWDLLGRYGCDCAQGFHLSRPLPAAQVPAWLGEVSFPPSAGRARS